MDFNEKDIQTEIDKLKVQLDHFTKEFTRANQYREQCRVDVIRLEGQIAQLEEMKTRKNDKPIDDKPKQEKK